MTFSPPKLNPLKNPLIFALDVDDEKQALALIEETSDIVGAIKLGPRLMLRYGPQILKIAAAKVPVFLDMKFFDIPSTMVSAVKSSFDMGATLVTVHAQAGIEALEQLALLESEYQKTGNVKILSVTILTSFDQKTLPPILKDQTIETHVERLSELVLESGLNGIVCSPLELPKLNTKKNLFLVTPGIRTDIRPNEDQKRVLTPKLAIESGASGIVVGRPILESKSPRDFCLNLLSEL